ncbi:MAG: protease complex subunit PrcB family protein, partial [Planctomycetaceae bacterium]|nr:protease complex subunit PrcB family protein [Planctomycetaceae bacterium]
DDGGGGGGGGRGGADGGAPINIQTLARGFSSNITTFQVSVVKDAASWQALWAQHGGAGAAPAVDFTVDMVVGFWTGTRTSGGYGAMVTGVTGADAPPGQTGAVVSLEEVRPGANCVVTGALTDPFHIVKTPRADVVTWQVSVRTAGCP